MQIQKKKIEGIFQEEYSQILEEEEPFLKQEIQTQSTNDSYFFQRQKQNIQKLQSIESEYVSVNSIYDSMNTVLMEQKQLLLGSERNMEHIVNHVENSNKELKDTVQITQNSGLIGKILIFITLIALALISVVFYV